MKSKAYWVRRTAALEAALQTNAAELSAEIILAYEKAIESINADIHQTFKSYVATGVPDGEAKKLLNSAENDKLYQELLQLYKETDNPKTKADILSRINAQAYGARISRLEGVKARIYVQLRKAANTAETAQKTLYTNTLQSSYYTNIYNIAEGLNCGIDFTLLPQRAIDKVLREPWHGKNYSERVWEHNDRFIKAVQDTITTGITAGHSVNRMAESLTEYVKDTAPSGIQTSTTTLVRSETSHFMNQGQLQAYKEIGITKYRYAAALAENTCERCAALDGKTFDIDKAVEGENYPPLHPNCRCITIMGDAVPSTRTARDPLTGKNYKVDGSMTFNEWKDSLTDEQKAALKYVDKSGGSGIIRENKTKKPVTVITDKAIDSVPFVYIPGYSEDQCYYIQAQHKELLEYARDCNKNKEVAFVLEDYDLYTRSKFKGEDDKIDFGHSLSGEDMVIIHNHPRNKSYSINDINFFKNFNGVKTLTIVKNNGSVEYLTKSVNYDAQIFRLEFNRLYKKMVKDGTDAELDRFVERLLNKTKSGVIWSEKK